MTYERLKELQEKHGALEGEKRWLAENGAVVLRDGHLFVHPYKYKKASKKLKEFSKRDYAKAEELRDFQEMYKKDA